MVKEPEVGVLNFWPQGQNIRLPHSPLGDKMVDRRSHQIYNAVTVESNFGHELVPVVMLFTFLWSQACSLVGLDLEIQMYLAALPPRPKR